MAGDNDTPHFTWQCPACGRQVPNGITECRCGVRWYEAQHVQEPLEASPGPSNAAQGPSAGAADGQASAGPRKRTRWWGVVGAAGSIAAVGLAFGVSALIPDRAGAPLTHGDIRILTRLDEHTRNAGPKVRNTIPLFLALPGRLGILESDVPPGLEATDAPADSNPIVKDVTAGELQKGFCSSSVPHLVRQQFPGAYDEWSDDKLERTVLKTHPEYRDRLCVLPPWVDAKPSNIVKYELITR